MAAPASTHFRAPVPEPRAYGQLAVVMWIWAGYFVVAKKAVNGADPLALGVARYLVAAVLLGALASRAGPLPRPTRRELWWLVVMGVSSIYAFNMLALAGLELATASDAALVMPTMPALVTIPVAALAFGERFGRRQVAGLAILVAGEILVFAEVVAGGDVSGRRAGGIAMFVAGAFLWGVYTIATRALGGRLGPISATFYAVLIGLVPLLLTGGWQAGQMFAANPGPGLWMAIFYLGALHTVLGFTWWYEGVHAVGAGRAAVMNTLVPVVALALAAIFLGESPSPARAVGSIVVVGGVLLAVTARPRRGGPSLVPPD